MLNVVVVDDEDRIRTGICKILLRSNKNVKVIGDFSNGLQAFESIMSWPPEEIDLVITDVKMPVMDGMKLIEQLSSGRPWIKIIILSGFSEFEYARTALHYGVMDYLLKPIDVQELENLLDKFSKAKREADQVGLETTKNVHRISEQIKTLIDKQYHREISLQALADEVYITPYYLSKLFKQETGETITDYMTRVRITKAKQLLEFQPELKVFEVAEHVGYPDPAYFNKLFKKMVGVTPKEYKDRRK